MKTPSAKPLSASALIEAISCAIDPEKEHSVHDAA